MKRLIAPAVVLFLLLHCSSSMAWHGLVVKVLDGDSIRVKRGNRIVEIRLYGIDAPEYGQRYGDRARYYLRSLLLRKTVSVEAVEVDRYKRLVALVGIHGRLANREMVRQGLAWMYPRYCKRKKLCGELKKLQDKARKQRRGLWKDKHPLSPWEFKRRKHSGSAVGFHREYRFPYWR
ncbi:thermonuclease family protein [Thermodesulfobacteriota bacterium B35]